MSHPDEEVSTDPATFWEERYRGGRSWSGRPNAALVREVGGLEPGRALDLGCGEGGDAIWLAQHGWRVTAVDISPAALALAAESAASVGTGTDITWVAADLAGWRTQERFDLVSAVFLHSPVELPREEILRHAASVVAPGGLLLVVGHAGFPPWSRHAPDPAALPGPAEVQAALGLSSPEWTVLTSAVVDREAVGPDGTVATLGDAVLAVRRNSPVGPDGAPVRPR